MAAIGCRQDVRSPCHSEIIVQTINMRHSNSDVSNTVGFSWVTLANIKTSMAAFILSRKYQEKTQSFPSFTPACSTAILHRNNYFRLYQNDNSRHNRCLFFTVRNKYKRIHEGVKFLFVEKMRHRIISKNCGYSYY